MAKREGKGWFAILLGKHVSFETIISQYLIDAIIFAKTSFNLDLLCDIINYRINENLKDDDKLDFGTVRKRLVEFKNSKTDLNSMIKEIENVIPDDQIITFLNSL